MSKEIKFYEFNQYEYYALIAAETEENAKLGYNENVADIDDEYKDLTPDIITEEEALKRYNKGFIECYITEEDKMEDFYIQLNNFKEYVSKGSKPYILLLIDGALI